jgi:hypothetical protein
MKTAFINEPTGRDQLPAVICQSGPLIFWRHPWASLRDRLVGFRQITLEAIQKNYCSWGTE